MYGAGRSTYGAPMPPRPMDEPDMDVEYGYAPDEDIGGYGDAVDGGFRTVPQRYPQMGRYSDEVPTNDQADPNDDVLASVVLPEPVVQGPNADGTYTVTEYVRDGVQVLLCTRTIKREETKLYVRQGVSQRERMKAIHHSTGAKQTNILSLKPGETEEAVRKASVGLARCKTCGGAHLSVNCPYHATRRFAAEIAPQQPILPEREQYDEPCVKVGGVYDEIITDDFLKQLIIKKTSLIPSRVFIPKEYETREYKGYAFINFETEAQVDRVLAAFPDGHLIHESHIKITFSKSQRKRRD